MDVSGPIRKIISVRTGASEAECTVGQHFRTLPNIDSMRILEIIVDTENAFGIEIPDDVTFRIQTIGDFEELVAGLCRQGTPS